MIGGALRVVREERAIRRVVVGYTAAFVGAHALAGSPRGLAYAAFITVGALMTAGVHARHPLPRALLWAAAAFGAIHCAGGLLPSPDPTQTMLYETWIIRGGLKVDQAVHAVGIGLATWGGWHIAERARTDARRLLGAGLVGTGVGVGNEVVEWLLDRALPTLVGDLTNAAWDVAFNVLGMTIALVLLVGSQRNDATPTERPGSRGNRRPVQAWRQSASSTTVSPLTTTSRS